MPLADLSQRTDGRGFFTRFFNQGQSVTLTAEPTYGRYLFDGWQNAVGEIIGTNPSLTVTLNQSTQVHPLYVVLGDYNRDGSVDADDHTLWRSSFGLHTSSVADGNRNGKVDAADYVVWRKNMSQTFTLPTGDYNGDLATNAADYVVWRKTLGAHVPIRTGADGDGNGVVEPADYNQWQANFGESAALGAGALAADVPIVVPRELAANPSPLLAASSMSADVGLTAMPTAARSPVDLILDAAIKRRGAIRPAWRPAPVTGGRHVDALLARLASGDNSNSSAASNGGLTLRQSIPSGELYEALMDRPANYSGGADGVAETIDQAFAWLGLLCD